MDDFAECQCYVQSHLSGLVVGAFEECWQRIAAQLDEQRTERTVLRQRRGSQLTLTSQVVPDRSRELVYDRARRTRALLEERCDRLDIPVHRLFDCSFK